jgi:hypothetical protein
MVISIFNDVRLKAIDRFVDIGGVFDHHCFLFITAWMP